MRVITGFLALVGMLGLAALAAVLTAYEVVTNHYGKERRA